MQLPRHIFVGRMRELRGLEAALAEMLSGRGRLILVAGEPGIGKTRTCEELAYTRDRGTCVVTGCCYKGAGAALDRICAAHPELGRHLTNALRTGFACAYRPEHPVVWRL